jgi:hypothetical protein
MNTVYYLGAGANAESIPVANQLNKTFESIQKVRLISNGRQRRPSEDENALRDFFVSYYPTIKQHPTNDIFAKKLFLRGPESDLNTLKKWLVVFFNFLEYSKPIDDKYIKFFASVIQLDNNKINLQKTLE